MTAEPNVILLSLLGGVLPAIFWLWFWLREDRLHPEPRSALISAFFGGIIAMVLALFFELIIYYLLINTDPSNIKNFPTFLQTFLHNINLKYNLAEVQNTIWKNIQNTFNSVHSFAIYLDAKRFFLIVVIAPIIEELLKLILTYNVCLRRKVNDEPIDASIYMLTVALGFAAMETALFLISPITNGSIADSLLASNFRSIGPMLVHLVSSAMLGIFIGLAFYKNKLQKFLYLISGLVIAILIHSSFNFFVYLNDSIHNMTFFWIACFLIWTMVIVLLLFFEKVKQTQKLI